MENKVNPLNAWGETFWSRHLKVFGFVKYFITIFLDLLEDKMRSPDLGMILAGYYLTGANISLLGIYESYAYCQTSYPNQYHAPSYLLLEKSLISRYSHYFYPLIFIGNIDQSPFFLSIFSALYCSYDFVLVLVDCFYCQGAFNNVTSNSWPLLYGFFKVTIAGLILLYWLIVIFTRKSFAKVFSVYALLGPLINWPLLKILRFRCCKEFQEVSKTPFEFPIRIKAAGVIASGIVIINSLIVRTKKVMIGSYKVYEVINDLQSYLDYLRTEPVSELFVLIRLKSEYQITVGSGKDLLKLLIEILEPVFPCIVVGYIGGFFMASLSIYNMFYMYKKIMLRIRSEGPDSETLKYVWRFSPYNAIFFGAQFIVNCFFICNMFAVALFLTSYLVSFNLIRELAWDFIKSRPASFWIGLVPVTLGTFYFPFLVDNRNFIKNKTYFCFWDTWYFLIGNIGALLKAIARYSIGFGSILLLGYRVDKSIMPAPFDKHDSLFCGFYGALATHCLKEKLIPSEILLKGSLNHELLYTEES